MSRFFRQECGRRYLRDTTLPYPLPVDLTELHRQTLRTVLLIQLWGDPFCNDHYDEDTPPTRVLEVACGSGLWSSACHDYFKRHGHSKISFTGMDVVSLAPDLESSGVNWRFVRHDMMKRPWPFKDGEFDFVFIKDASLCNNKQTFQEPPLKEIARVLRSGGVAEIWDGDTIIRSLLPNPTPPPNVPDEDLEHAKANSFYIVAPSTGFAPPQNRFLLEFNHWVEEAFSKRGLHTAPCLVAKLSFEMGDRFTDVEGQRLALPLSETRWEEEAGERLDRHQQATRETALVTVVEYIEALECVLMAESGKRRDEWDRWAAAMKDDLLNKKGTMGGECLELGAWWAKKI